ncbi:hypothetical protein ACFLVX_00500 [Chloroflexota bacterium]
MKKSGFCALPVLVCASLLSIIGLTIGCGGERATEMHDATLEQLFTNPDNYDGKQVIIEGFYFHGFETLVLSERLEYSGYAEGHIVPKGKMLWVEGGIPKEIYDKLKQQQMMGPSERYGKLRIKGKYEYGGKYGHLGAYSSQIVPSGVEFLSWSPPTAQSERQKGEGFAIYLPAQDISTSEMSSASQMVLENIPIVSMEDVVSYNGQTHEIMLAAEATERLLKLDVPVNGKVFVVCVDRQPVYWGAFWTPISSMSFDGVTIFKPTSPNVNTIKIELGYPSGSLFSGDDPRAESRVVKSLEQADKLIK